jgi:hypothetical protein
VWIVSVVSFPICTQLAVLRAYGSSSGVSVLVGPFPMQYEVRSVVLEEQMHHPKWEGFDKIDGWKEAQNWDTGNTILRLNCFIFSNSCCFRYFVPSRLIVCMSFEICEKLIRLPLIITRTLMWNIICGDSLLRWVPDTSDWALVAWNDWTCILASVGLCKSWHVHRIEYGVE